MASEIGSARAGSAEPLAGKVALVTGGSRGIGHAIAVELARRGCHVIITGRDEATLKMALSEGQGEAHAKQDLSSAGLSSFVCDVRDAKQIAELGAHIRQTHGGLDFLVNNAGVAHPLKDIEGLSIEDWKAVIDTNLTGLFLVTREMVALLRGGGAVVNNLSVASEKSFAGFSGYCASKAGALAFTNVLREEMRKRGVRVIALKPGAVSTGIWEQFWPEAPRGKMMSAVSVARMVGEAVSLPPRAAVDEISINPAEGVL